MSEGSVYGPYGSGQGTPGSPRSTTLERVSSGPEQPRLRMRQRLAWFGAANRPPQSAVLDPLFSVVKANHPKTDLEQLERAYHTAEHYHRGQIRKSGEPYITHPLAVATILAELGMTESTLCAALLHDTVEDTSYTLDQLRADFGDEIARLVDGVTKLWLRDVTDADGGGVADVDGRSMNFGDGAGYLHRLHDLIVGDGAHGDDHLAKHLPRRLAVDVRHIHAHVAPHGVVVHLDARLDKL